MFVKSIFIKGIKAYATSQDEHPQIVTISDNVPMVWHEQCNLLARGIWSSTFDGNYRRSSTGKDKPSSRRVGNHVDGRRTYPGDIPQPTTGRGRGKERSEIRKGVGSRFPLFTSNLESSVTEASIRRWYPRARDYKVTDEGTERSKGSRCSRAIR